MGKRVFQAKKNTPSLCKEQEVRGSGAIWRTQSSLVWLQQEGQVGVGREEIMGAAKGWEAVSTWRKQTPDLMEVSTPTGCSVFQKAVFHARNQLEDTVPGLISEGGNHVPFSQVTHLLGFHFQICTTSLVLLSHQPHKGSVNKRLWYLTNKEHKGSLLSPLILLIRIMRLREVFPLRWGELSLEFPSLPTLRLLFFPPKELSVLHLK